MKLPQYLEQFAQAMKHTYLLKGSVIGHNRAFSPIGVLPGLCKRADELASLCLGESLGFAYTDDAQALLGVEVTCPQEKELPAFFFLVDVLIELQQASAEPSAISLDELMMD